MTARDCDGEHGSGRITVRFRVRGRVQGVYFRGSTRTEALRLGLRGHARNLADGSVEVLAHGPPAAVEALARWLEEGPPLARVSGIERTTLDPGDAGERAVGFEIS